MLEEVIFSLAVSINANKNSQIKHVPVQKTLFLKYPTFIIADQKKHLKND